MVADESLFVQEERFLHPSPVARGCSFGRCHCFNIVIVVAAIIVTVVIHVAALVVCLFVYLLVCSLACWRLFAAVCSYFGPDVMVCRGM